MNESACISDLGLYELDRRSWLIEHDGSLDGFTCERGVVLATEAATCTALNEHTMIPGHIDALVLTDDNRFPLGESINGYKKNYRAITDRDITVAKAFVQTTFSVTLGDICVIRVKPHVMTPASFGVVYSCGVHAHVIVMPESSFDPMGTLVAQFAIAAHYTLMRGKPGIAAMISDPLTQAMVAHYSMLRYAAQHPDNCSVMHHLQHLVSWEFAKGLSKTPETPLGFVASELGEQLMKTYGGGMFRAVIQDLYESMTHGRAIYFGCNNFNGMALALALLGDDHGMAMFMQIDTADRRLADKLFQAFPGLDMPGIADFQVLFNERLAGIITTVAAKAA